MGKKKLDIDINDLKQLPYNLIQYICNNYKWITLLNKIGLIPSELEYLYVPIKDDLLYIIIMKTFKDMNNIERTLIISNSFYLISNLENIYDIRNIINFKISIENMIKQIENKNKEEDEHLDINELLGKYDKVTNIFNAMCIVIELDSIVSKELKINNDYKLFKNTINNNMDLRDFSLEEANILWKEMDDFVSNIKKNIK